jgi:hypothetical protein
MTDEELIDAMDGLPGDTDDTEGWTFVWVPDVGWEIVDPTDD